MRPLESHEHSNSNESYIVFASTHSFFSVSLIRCCAERIGYGHAVIIYALICEPCLIQSYFIKLHNWICSLEMFMASQNAHSRSGGHLNFDENFRSNRIDAKHSATFKSFMGDFEWIYVIYWKSCQTKSLSFAHINTLSHDKANFCIRFLLFIRRPTLIRWRNSVWLTPQNTHKKKDRKPNYKTEQNRTEQQRNKLSAWRVEVLESERINRTTDEEERIHYILNHSEILTIIDKKFHKRELSSISNAVSAAL